MKTHASFFANDRAVLNFLTSKIGGHLHNIAYNAVVNHQQPNLVPFGGSGSAAKHGTLQELTQFTPSVGGSTIAETISSGDLIHLQTLLFSGDE
mmetsp:Transcript_6550/g.10118  ORF Transcript_6550/g.10118 Transcript_6550/m.10118 type:complete len:94 (+) Transcript_6550:70-351(+)